jgi:SAM-dependent methyltransferase
MSRRARIASAALALAACCAANVCAQEEVPFITSPDAVTLEMLRSADVKPADFVVDLGSGDGRIVITAARLFGARGLGVEIVPELVQKSRDNARRAGVEDRAEFREQDLFRTDLAQASVVTLYLLPEVNLQLRPSLLALKPGTRIVSHDWDMGDWRPDRTTELDVPEKQVGREKKSRVHLWIVPARVAGSWCGEGAMRDARLAIEQRHQFYWGTLRQPTGSSRVGGVVRGNELRPAQGQGDASALRLEGDSLQRVGGQGRSGAFHRC